MKQNSMKEVLECLILTVKASLDEIAVKAKRNDFVCGEIYAYLECLEVIQTWCKAEEYGLCGNLEEKYLTE